MFAFSTCVQHFRNEVYVNVSSCCFFLSFQVYGRDWQGNTCMHIAAQYGNLEALRDLLVHDRQNPDTDGLHIMNK